MDYGIIDTFIELEHRYQMARMASHPDSNQISKLHSQLCGIRRIVGVFPTPVLSLQSKDFDVF